MNSLMNSSAGKSEQISEIASKRADQLAYKFFSYLRREIFRVSRRSIIPRFRDTGLSSHYNFPVKMGEVRVCCVIFRNCYT